MQWQSHQSADHHAALAKLRQQGRLYRCICSRSETAHPYPGTCRDAGAQPRTRPARCASAGCRRCRHSRTASRASRSSTPAELGDPVLLRRDGIIAYQLAVVVDDLAQGITDVVRGADLLDSTPWQMQIASALGGAAAPLRPCAAAARTGRPETLEVAPQCAARPAQSRDDPARGIGACSQQEPPAALPRRRPEKFWHGE